MTTNKEPAFPSGLKEIADDEMGAIHTGMTLRDYFAAKAIAEMTWSQDQGITEKCAEHCYRIADAMLKARAA